MTDERSTPIETTEAPAASCAGSQDTRSSGGELEPESRLHVDDTDCCAPRRDIGERFSRAAAPSDPVAKRSASRYQRQLRLPGGTFSMGDSFDEGYASDGEGPVHSVTVSPFWMDVTSVTNAQFATFVKATGHVTDAEQAGSSAVFHLSVASQHNDVLGRASGAPWWVEVAGADWRHPEGRLSDIRARQNHPVVHVSWFDAMAYAAWAGKRLATEAEWEYAARGGLHGYRFPWGDALKPRGKWLCNIWQGEFPVSNTLEDGFSSTAPAKSFHQNGYGLWSLVGNVWEWCADWFSPATYSDRATTGGVALDPSGPRAGDSRTMRGGSFLCHDSYCYRYRVAARSSNTPESSSSNIGFRCANDDSDIRGATAALGRR